MSGQTQPETALQSLAEKLRTDAIAIFGEGQAERDIIEWFYAALLAAAPKAPEGLEFPRYVCRKCKQETRPPEPYKAYVLCDCGYMTAATTALAASTGQERGEVQRLREALERATKLLSAAAGYATKMEPMPAKLLNAIDAELDASTGQEVEK